MVSSNLSSVAVGRSGEMDQRAKAGKGGGSDGAISSSMTATPLTNLGSQQDRGLAKKGEPAKQVSL